MNTSHIIAITLAALVFFFAAHWLAWVSNACSVKPPHTRDFANIATGRHEERISLLTDAALTTRYLLAKHGSDASHAAACGANDRPIGVFTDEAGAAEASINVDLLSAACETKIAVGAAAIAANKLLYTAAGGKVQELPNTAGVYWCVGRSLSAATADGDQLEYEPQTPSPTVVIAALGNVNGAISGLTISASYSQAEVQALRAACETLADDLRAVVAALTSAGVVVQIV